MNPCKCKGWCSDGRPPLTNHHRHCQSYDPVGDALALTAALIKGIEDWAADCDGVHPDAWDAYCRAVLFVGDLAKFKSLMEKPE